MNHAISQTVFIIVELNIAGLVVLLSTQRFLSHPLFH